MESSASFHVGLSYLQEATEIFKEWHSSRKAGLTTETFTACIQTMSALPELASFLIKKHGFRYLLLGKLMSDPIEARFGWYRQVNGGNFFMSVKQLLLAEKKIKSLSLLQKQVLISAFKLDSDRKNAPSTHEDSSTDEDLWLLEYLLAVVSLDEMPQADAAVTYYVSGYIGRSISLRRKCSGCTQLVVGSTDMPNIQENVPEEHRELFEMADRGGLSEPTEFCYAVTTLAVQCYTAISENDEIMKKLLRCSNQQRVFMSAVRKFLCSVNALSNLAYIKCNQNHENLNLILQKTYNCCAKNQLKRMNSRPMLETPPPKALRTISKLTSKGSSRI